MKRGFRMCFRFFFKMKKIGGVKKEKIEDFVIVIVVV